MNIDYREMVIQDHEFAYKLWEESEGVDICTHGTDSLENIKRYLQRNPGCCHVAFEDDMLVGVALAGHDGKRGLIHHVAVAKTHQRQGIAEKLVSRCMAGLQAAGIPKCHVLVHVDNDTARQFWEETGWTLRRELVLYSKYTVV